MSFSETAKYSENQNNNPNQQIDFVAKFKNNYRNDPNAQELAKNQDWERQKLNQENSQEQQNITTETWEKTQELSQEILTPERIKYLLNTYSNLIQNHRETLRDIQNSMNENTSLLTKWIDSVMWLFTNENAFAIYQKSFNLTKENAIRTIKILQSKLNFSSLTPEQQQKYQTILKDLQEICLLKLESTWIIQMTKNEIMQLPDNIKNAWYGIKWEAIWLYEWWKAIITWSIDLAKFMWKYGHSFIAWWEYHQKINEQANEIWEYLQKDWAVKKLWWKVKEALQSEMDRISSLPQEEQAEEIWKIAWNVIAMLTAIKAWMAVADKLWKMWTAVTATEKLQKAGLVTADVALNWVAESAISKSLALAYKKFSSLPLREMLKLWDADRILAWEAFLWRKLTEAQKEAILKAHNIWSLDVNWKYTQEDLMKKTRILDEAWFSVEDRRILMEKWVCGKPSISPEEVFRRLDFEVNEAWIPKEYLRLVEESWFTKLGKLTWNPINLTKFYENWTKKQILDYNAIITKFVKENPYWIDLLDAHLIFWYTNESFIDLMNTKLWNKIPLIPSEQAIVDKLRRALEKLPNVRWKLTTQFRWDNRTFIWKEAWDIVEFPAFTSCSNPPTKEFWDEAIYKVTINNAKAKAITRLALFPNGWYKLIKTIRPTQESILLPWSKVKITSKKSIGRNAKWQEIFEIEVEQL